MILSSICRKYVFLSRGTEINARLPPTSKKFSIDFHNFHQLIEALTAVGSLKSSIQYFNKHQQFKKCYLCTRSVSYVVWNDIESTCFIRENSTHPTWLRPWFCKPQIVTTITLLVEANNVIYVQLALTICHYLCWVSLFFHF